MSSESLRLTQEEWEKMKEREKWLDEHPFTKKWYETCQPAQYDKPKHKLSINKDEINIEEDMSREIEIEGRNEFKGDQSHKRIPVGTKYNGIEVIKPQTDLDEYEDDTQEEETKPCSVLKKYQKDVVENDIKKRLSKNVLTPEEEEALKEKFVHEKTDEIMKQIEGLRKEYLSPLCEVKFEPGEQPPVYTEITFEDIAKELVELHRKKNNDYGDAAHQSYKEFGITSYVIRLNDKLNRLKALTKPGATMKVQDESIIDTLKDLAAYAIMAIESLSTWR